MKMIAKGIWLTRKILQVIEDDEPEPHPGPIFEPSDNSINLFSNGNNCLLTLNFFMILIDLVLVNTSVFFRIQRPLRRHGVHKG